MNEHQEKQRFKRAIDHTLSGMTGDPFLYQRVMTKAEKGDMKVKYAIPKGVVIALIVVLCMGTAAMASGTLGGFVNWKGEFIPEETQSLLPGPTAAPEMSVDMIDFKLAQELVQSADDLEIVLVTQENMFGGTSSTSNRLEMHPESYADFLALMESSPEIPIPAFIPQGYELYECQVVFDCRKSGGYVLTSEQTVGDGIAVKRYRVAPEDAFVSGYHLSFRRNGNPEDYLGVHVSLYAANPLSTHHIGVNEDQTFAVMEVAGMENALVITGDTHTTLTMRRALPKRVDYRIFDMEEDGYVASYREVHVDIMTRQVDVAVLADMFATE